MPYIRSKFGIVLISMLFLIVGLGAVFFSYISFTGSQKFIKTSISADGTVTDIVQQTNTSDTNGRTTISYTYAPKISFTASDGKTYTFISSTSSNPSPYHDEETIKILYDPQNPYNAQINSFFDLWGLSIILGGLGVVFGIIGILGVIFPGVLVRN